MVCESHLTFKDTTCGRRLMSPLPCRPPGVSTPSPLRHPQHTGLGALSPVGAPYTALGITSAVASTWTPFTRPPALVLPAPALQHHSPGRLIMQKCFLTVPSRKTALLFSLSPLSLLLHCIYQNLKSHQL